MPANNTTDKLRNLTVRAASLLRDLVDYNHGNQKLAIQWLAEYDKLIDDCKNGRFNAIP